LPLVRDRGLNAATQQEAGPVFRASSEMMALYLLLVLIGRFIFGNLFLALLAQAYSDVTDPPDCGRVLLLSLTHTRTHTPSPPQSRTHARPSPDVADPPHARTHARTHPPTHSIR
jgi:hypothetical protein